MAALLCLAALLSSPAPATQAECEVAGGVWARRGLLATELCDLPTADAGKPCTKHDDCESVCIAPDGARAGDRVTGQCYARSVTLGTCLPYVIDGVVQPVMCVD